MKKATEFNKSLIIESGLTAKPGTVLTAGRSYAWLTFAAQAKESVLWIEEIGFSGFTPLVAAALNSSVNPTSNHISADVAESETGGSVRGMETMFIPVFGFDTRPCCDTIARLKS